MSDPVVQLVQGFNLPPLAESSLPFTLVRVAGDLAICAAFAVVPVFLLRFTLSRRGVLPRSAWLLIALLSFAGMICILSAAEHLSADFRPIGTWLRIVLAAIAWLTVLSLVPAIPAILDRKSPEELQTHIAERERAESALRESQAAYTSLLETLPLHIFRKDQEGRLITANQRYCETVGLPLEKILGKTDQELFPEEQARKYRRDDERVLLSGEPWEDIERHVRADGQVLYVQVLKAPVRNSQGRIIGTQGMFWDVTERVQADEAARRSDARFRCLLQSSLIGVIVCTLDGRIIDANDAFLNMMGYLRDDLKSNRLRWDTITPPEHAEADQRAVELLRTAGTCPPWEKEYIRSDGSRVPILLGVTMLEGSATECVCFVIDHSEHREHERQLEAAKEAADAANQAKSRFLANMSHEVRTPLNAVIGLTELVLKTTLTPKHREFLELSLQSAESLLALINDVLDFSKVEAGKMELQVETFNLRDVVSDAVRALAVRAFEKGLELACHIPPKLPERLIGDAGKLRQVLLNLVGNAVKFTPEGEVVVEVAELSRTGNRIELRFDVRDTGIGIAPEKMEKIFEPFEQADSTTTRQYGGTGLGLSIVRRLTELMGGAVAAKSSMDQGSTFSFTVRMDVGPPSETSTDPHALVGKRVLIVDDNATNRRIFIEVTRAWDMTSEACDSAARGLEALAAAKAAGAPFDIIFSDLQMPKQDGLFFARAVQQLPEPRPAFILLTSGQHLDEGRRRQLGIAANMLKPVKQSELLTTLLAALQLTEPADDPARPRETTLDGRTLRILLAEDSVVNQRLALGLLEHHGHQITIADTGVKATAAAFTDTFDLILMDVQMPEMDGLEATRRIRAREREQGGHVPIIAMTAHALAGDRERCLEAGMDDYVTKPIREARLLDAIRKLLGTASAPAAVDSESPPSPPETDGEEIVDWRAAVAVCNGDRALLREIVEAFLEEHPVRMGEIETAIATRNAELLGRAAHTIKGAMRYFGAQAVYERAFALEQLGAGGELSQAEEMYRRLQLELARLLPQMQLLLDGKIRP